MKTNHIGMIAAISLALMAQAPVYAQKTTGTQAVENLDTTAVPDLDRGKVRRVQLALHEKGFDPGAANGLVNAKTKAAVEKFQDRFGIKATGAINNQTLLALGIVGDTAPAAEEEKAPKESKEAPSQPRREPKPTARERREKYRERESERRAETGSRGGGRIKWCAAYHNGSQNCGFYTLDQCQASVSGVGGSCVPN
ncbi:MAG: peptidoglycan-binding domain-containing protein [Bryobacteraceae bacterium]